MNIDDYDEDTLSIGDLVEYRIVASKYHEAAIYGRIVKFKHGQVYINPAIREWDMGCNTYVSKKFGPYMSSDVMAMRTAEEVRKFNIEEMI